MSNLPEEICLDILLRVPVRSLLICKSVCKSWCSLISDPDFVKLHLNRTTKTSNCSLIFKSDDEISFNSITYDSLASSTTESVDDVVVVMGFPYNTHNIRLFGSCNGLVYGMDDLRESYFLWNPATKEYKTLPKPQTGIDNSVLDILYGFGYDYKNDDYKLVEILVHRKSWVVQTYSLKSNSWKSFQSIQYEVGFYATCGVLFNGALHWLGLVITKLSTALVSMDISVERLKDVQLSRTLPLAQVYYINMGELQGCLCVLAKFKGTVEVWVMQDYGVPESWTKLYTITDESIRCYSKSEPEIIGSFKNGEILFYTPSRMDSVVIYEPKYGALRKPSIRCLNLGGAVNYFESLISLNSITEVDEGNKEITGNLKKSETKKRNRNARKHKGG